MHLAYQHVWCWPTLFVNTDWQTFHHPCGPTTRHDLLVVMRVSSPGLCLEAASCNWSLGIGW
jgi:hypothetical protein